MARTQTVTILFCDLVASTERRAHLGDDAFDEFSGRYIAALDDAIAQNNGRNIASAGDGLMVVFPESVADAIACATTMHRAAAALDPRDPPLLRIGISSGEVAQDGDGYSGMPIVEAARLEAAAAPGQTLAHSIIRTLVGTRRAFRFRDVGALTLKGIPVPVSTVEVIDDQVVEAPPPTRHPSAKAPRRPATRWLLAGAVGLAVVLAVAGFIATRGTSSPPAVVAAPPGISAPKGYTPKYTSSPCPATVLSAASNARCGHLVVPQDRAKPLGMQVSLLVTSAPARRAGPTLDPTIDVCGCEDLGNSLARDHSELIHVAIRGFTDSDPVLTCPEMSAVRDADLTKGSFDPGALARGVDGMRKCHARLVASGIDPAQYNSDTAAQDVLDLMFAMNIHRANFVAFENIDIEVFDVLRRAPAAVRSLTLDNPPPPGTTALTDSTGDLSGAFQRYVALCNVDPICVKAYPDLGKAWQTAFANIQTQPELITVPNPARADGPPVHVLLDGTRGADGLAVALGDPKTYALIPAAIAQTTGQPAAAAEAVQADYTTPSEPWGAEASYGCSYDLNTIDGQAQILEARTLPQFVRSELVTWTQWCNVWKVPNIAAALSTPIVSDVPTLLFRGDLAPNGNPTWIPTIERGMSNAQDVVFPTLGRDLLANGPPCLSALRRAFLASPDAKLDTAACAKQSPPIRFVAPLS
jgi:class 3 adenylate cyclase/pimeloyl-ACP methyl ester carboxylesterase